MARKPSPPPTDKPLDPDQIKQGIDRLRRRIVELEKFDPTSVQERWAPETRAIETSIDDTLSRIFGHGTPRYHRYRSACDLDNGPVFMGGGPSPLFEVHKWLSDGKAAALALLNEAVKGLEEDLADFGGSPAPQSAVQSASMPNDEVFIVHGHHDAAKVEVARLIERAGLKPVILHEQPNAGKTIIEKFEKHGSAAGFAVVIATPDDVGGRSAAELRPRARQNVIGEMFWFAGRLGRDRVCTLLKGDLEMPSDVAGIGYTPMDDHGGWKMKLLKELEAAGYTRIDWKKALG